ncbi:hypothetical protein [Acinetobacter baumannii]|uniref:hypothetical protein n=1 Tax=Acinetobacter baumannii TaxID=470 RepID=UPI0024BD3FC9|nr:hypothetical protein [Acinetobacter baumannii]WFT03486.1 hypothetical protein MTS08_18760 [Acinetobacter baumannii]
MANKSLNEKFKIIGFWTFGGIFWYLLISFFLLSDYPIQDYPFNHKKTYEVLKDALSLAAAFLAPVAAFVLFSDWRDQHRSISNEKVSRQIVDNLSDLLPFIGKSDIYLTNQEEINKFSQSYFSYVIQLRRNATSINAINSESEKFIIDMKVINLFLMNIWFSLERQIVLNQELEKITSFDERSEALRKSYFKNIQEAGLNKDQYVSEFLNLKNTIRILYV